jgi:hypothetical protein
MTVSDAVAIARIENTGVGTVAQKRLAEAPRRIKIRLHAWPDRDHFRDDQFPEDPDIDVTGPFSAH